MAGQLAGGVLAISATTASAMTRFAWKSTIAGRDSESATVSLALVCLQHVTAVGPLFTLAGSRLLPAPNIARALTHDRAFR